MKTIALAFLLSSATLMAADPLADAAAAAAASVVSQALVPFVDVFGGKFRPMDNSEAFPIYKAGTKAFAEKDYKSAVASFRVLAESGRFPTMEKCAEILFLMRDQANTEAATLKKKDKNKKESEAANFNTEGVHWLYLSLCKRAVDGRGKPDLSKGPFSLLGDKSRHFVQAINFCYEQPVEGRIFQWACNYLDPRAVVRHIDLSDELIISNFIWLCSGLSDGELFGIALRLYQDKKTIGALKDFLSKDEFSLLHRKSILDYMADEFFKGSLKSQGDADRKAEYFFRKSNDSWESRWNLAVMYYQGRAGKFMSAEDRDAEIVKLIESVSENVLEARYNLGVFYRDGRAGRNLTQEQRDQKAEDFFKSCQDLPIARQILASMYMTGQAGHDLTQKQRDQKALELFETCQELPKAKLNLGYMYMTGQAGHDLTQEQRDQKALELFETCQELPRARANLAVMYVYMGKNEEFVQQCLRTLPPELIKHIDKAISLQKIKNLESKDSAVDDADFEAAHMEDLQDGGSEEGLADALMEMMPPDDPSSGDDNSEAGPSEPGPSSVDDNSEAGPSKFHKRTKAEKKREAAFRHAKEIAKQRQVELVRRGVDDVRKPSRTIVFKTDAIREQFDAMTSDARQGRNMDELMKDILFYGHKLEGMGKPEKLKHGAFAGLWSRRINHEDRLVYRVEGDKIVIVSCKGHYDD